MQSEFKKEKLIQAVFKAGKMLWRVFPIILGTILLVSLANTTLPKSFFLFIFQNNFLLDPIIGSLIGSILAGNPVTSYILGGEFLKHNCCYNHYFNIKSYVIWK